METGDSRVGESFIGGTMASYSEDDAAQARRIVEGLLGREREAHDIDENLVISDIEADAHEFSEELDLLDDLDLGVPAFRIGGEGEQVPVTVSLALGGTWPLRFAFAQYANRRLLRHLLLQELDFDLRGVLSPKITRPSPQNRPNTRSSVVRRNSWPQGWRQCAASVKLPIARTRGLRSHC